jgi:hypothetical protein
MRAEPDGQVNRQSYVLQWSLPGGDRAGPKMAKTEDSKTGTEHNTQHTFRETTFRETITPSRPSNSSVHNLDIKSDIMH